MVESGFCCYTTGSKPSEKETDFEKKLVAWNKFKNPWCIHEVMFYANKFVQNLFFHAKFIVESLPREQAESFDKAFVALSLAAKVLRDDDPLRDIARNCGSDCRWKEMLKNDIVTKCMIFGHTINKSEAEKLYEKTLQDNTVKTLKHSEIADENPETLMNEFIKTLYQEAYFVLASIPKPEAKFLKKEIRKFVESLRKMQDDELRNYTEKCGLRCCNWFRKKEPVEIKSLNEIDKKTKDKSPSPPVSNGSTPTNENKTITLEPEAPVTEEPSRNENCECNPQ
jgi:hypothetical protein